MTSTANSSFVDSCEPDDLIRLLPCGAAGRARGGVRAALAETVRVTPHGADPPVGRVVDRGAGPAGRDHQREVDRGPEAVRGLLAPFADAGHRPVHCARSEDAVLRCRPDVRSRRQADRENRFAGAYTTTAKHRNATTIPVAGKRVRWAIHEAGVPPEPWSGHACSGSCTIPRSRATGSQGEPGAPRSITAHEPPRPSPVPQSAPRPTERSVRSPDGPAASGQVSGPRGQSSVGAWLVGAGRDGVVEPRVVFDLGRQKIACWCGAGEVGVRQVCPRIGVRGWERRKGPLVAVRHG